MTFLTPLYAIIAASIAVPSLVILYFLKLRRQDLEISTTLLWKKAIQDMQANAPFQKLRRNLLLFLQLLILAAVILALGQPRMKGQLIKGSQHVILIDRSASMSALDCDDGRGGKRTRLEEAKGQAVAFVKSLREANLFSKGSADEAMVIAFDSAAEVRQTFTGDKESLRRAIESITPTENPTRVEEAIQLARAHIPSKLVENQGLVAGPPVSLQLYSDGRLSDADKAKPGPEDSFTFNRIGREDSYNAAIVGLRSERGFDDPTKLSIYVALQNDEAVARTADVELSIDGVVAGIKPANIPAATEGDLTPAAEAAARAREGEAKESIGADVTMKRVLRPGIGGVVFTMDRAQGAVVQTRLRSPGSGESLIGDALPEDDRAWIVIPPARKMAVAVVSQGSSSLFLTSVLSGLPLARLDTLSPGQFEKLREDAKLALYDVVLLDGYLPKALDEGRPIVPPPPTPASEPTSPKGGADAKAPTPPGLASATTAGLPPGRFLVLNAVPANVGLSYDPSPPDTGGGIVDWKRDHPALRSANIESVVVGRSKKVAIVPGAGAEAIASLDSGPAIVEFANAQTRAIIVPFDVAESNWPFDVSFVIFMANAVTHLGDDGGASGGRLIQPGSVLADRLPGGAEDARVRDPDGTFTNITVSPDGRVVFGPVSRSGVYQVSWKGPAGPTDSSVDGRVVRPFAANLFDSAESVIAAKDQLDLASRQVFAVSGGSTDADKSLWPWLLLAALMVVAFEWWVYNRRVYL